MTCLAGFLVTHVGVTALCRETEGRDLLVLQKSVALDTLELIQLNQDGSQFVRSESGARFIAWGFNYDHDDSGRLIEDYWHEAWSTVQEDFAEMKALGANVVRIHLQLSQFMRATDRPNQALLQQLGCLVRLAERTGLSLDITGLGRYHEKLAAILPYQGA